MKKILMTFILTCLVLISFAQINKISDQLFENDFLLNNNFNNQKSWINTTVDFCYNDWDTISNSWKESWKTSTTYNSDGKVTLKISQLWDNTGNTWVNDDMEENTYNSNTMLVEDIKSIWNSTTNTWVYSQKGVSTWDSTLLLTRIVFNWDTLSSTWKESRKTECIQYDVNGKLLEVIDYQWNSSLNQWDNFLRGVYTRDANGNSIQSIFYFWIGIWDYNSKTVNDFDINNNLIHSYRYIRNSNAWRPSTEKFYVYDAYYQQIEERSYLWNQSLGLMIEHKKITQSYDALGNRVEYINYDWDSSLSNWYYVNKSENFYDLDNNMIELRYYVWNNQLLTWDDNMWGYLCTLTSTSQNINDDNILTIYPNPSKGIVYLAPTNSFKTIWLYSMTGEVILKKEYFTENQLNLESVINGIYFIVIKDGEKIHKQKLVLLK